MWEVVEHRDIAKTCHKLLASVVKKYESWKEIVAVDGPERLKSIPGLHDEKLMGIREGQRSSRLNLQYRVIYTVERLIVTVFVLEVTPHKY